MFKPIPIWPDFTLVIISYEFGQIMTRHDFLEARWVILSNVLTFGKFSVSRKPIMNGGAIRPVGLLFSDIMYVLLPAVSTWKCQRMIDDTTISILSRPLTGLPWNPIAKNWIADERWRRASDGPAIASRNCRKNHERCIARPSLKLKISDSLEKRTPVRQRQDRPRVHYTINAYSNTTCQDIVQTSLRLPTTVHD